MKVTIDDIDDRAMAMHLCISITMSLAWVWGYSISRCPEAGQNSQDIKELICMSVEI